MPANGLPQGRYLSCAFRVSLDAGGQTRAMLMRNRILAAAGVRPDVLVLGAAPDHDARRAVLLERGLLADGVGLLNIYEHARDRHWGEPAPTGATLVDLSAHCVREETGADGEPWRRTYRGPGERYATYDYLRADGSPYLRIPAFGLAAGSRGHGLVQQVGADGQVLGEFKTAGQWFRRWIRELAEGQQRTFVFIDSRHVVPQPVPAEPLARDPARVAIVARLEAQKGLGDAIAAFAGVVEAVPAARLDIYGEGSRRDRLQAEIARLGLDGHVTLRGFDPEAREVLWRSSAFLMTSSFEGYPLATLESMSRGCPVVSYDIKYGPREQITDGVDGFLVPRGDVARLADRIIELLRSPELVARMGAAARATAERHDAGGFLEDWE